MRNKFRPEDVLDLIMNFRTKCGKWYKLVRRKGVTFLCNETGIHPSCKELLGKESFNMRHFVCDPSIHTDNEDLLKCGLQFLKTYGSKGKVGVKVGSKPWFVIDKNGEFVEKPSKLTVLEEHGR
jgi:hypothetical protein